MKILNGSDLGCENILKGHKLYMNSAYVAHNSNNGDNFNASHGGFLKWGYPQIIHFI